MRVDRSRQASREIPLAARPPSRVAGDEALDELARRLGDLAPAAVDREGVASVRDLDDLRHGGVPGSPLGGGVRDRPRHCGPSRQRTDRRATDEFVEGSPPRARPRATRQPAAVAARVNGNSQPPPATAAARAHDALRATSPAFSWDRSAPYRTRRATRHRRSHPIHRYDRARATRFARGASKAWAVGGSRSLSTLGRTRAVRTACGLARESVPRP